MGNTYPGFVFFMVYKVMYWSQCASYSVCFTYNSIMENGWKDFMKLSGWVWHGTRNHLEYFGKHVVYIGYSIFLLTFQGNPCLSATLKKNGWTDFHEIFRIGQTWHKGQLVIVGARWFNAWLGCCMLLKLDVVEIFALNVLLVYSFACLRLIFGN